MIKLTINPETEKKTYEFNKSEITISSSEVESCDVQFPFESFDDVSLKIEENSGTFFIFNLANNPFVTINDMPFGKSKIENNDRIQAGDTIILFEVDSKSFEKTSDLSTPLQLMTPPNFSSKTNIENLLDEKIQAPTKERKKQTVSLFDDEKNTFSSFSYSKKDELIPEIAENDDEIDIHTLLQEVENLAPPPSVSEKIDNQYQEEYKETYTPPSQDALEEFFTKRSEPQKNNISNQNKDPSSSLQKNLNNQSLNSLRLEKDPTSDIEEKNDPISKQFQEWADFNENSQEPAEKITNDTSPFKKWKIWMGIFVLMVTTSIVISKGVYNRLNENAQKTELQAARMISDIALALTYAQINHIKPQQQNWTDPHFLKNSIHSVLSSYQEPVVTIDNHGKLNDGKYLLRIYTNRDASRFLAIAQPEPSLTQWIAPQSAIVLDSQSMKLHRVDDLKALNRLLVNPNSLSGDSGHEVADLVEKQPIIPLKELESKDHTYGFAPPKQLELMSLDAENYVYNAPRYSQVGESIMEQAIDLFSRPISASELKKLQESINTISKLPHAVLYTSKGMKVALKAQKSLNNFAPDHKFLVAYMQFNPEGQIASTHLILDSDVQTTTEKSALQKIVKENSREIGSYQPLVLAAKAPEYLTPQEVYQKNVTNSFEEDVDPTSPLYEELTTIHKSRKEKLEPISEKVIALMKENTENSIDNFPDRLKKLLIQYFDTTEQVEQDSSQKLKELSRKYSFMPISQFNKYIKATGLEILMEQQTTIPKEKSKITPTESSTPTKVSSNINQEFETILKNIAAAQNLEELNKATMQSSKLLRLENVPNSTELIEYQNTLRTHVINKLNELIFSPESPIHNEETSSSEGKKLLSKILLHSWIIDPEERNYYLEEYDKLFRESDWETEWKPEADNNSFN